MLTMGGVGLVFEAGDGYDPDAVAAAVGVLAYGGENHQECRFAHFLFIDFGGKTGQRFSGM